MSKRLAESTAEGDTDQEKKQRPTAYAPEFFHRNTIQQATVKMGKQYKANDDKTQFVPPAVLGAHNFEFMGCMNPWGPDALVLIYPPPGKTAKDRLTLDVHRKTAEAKEFRVVYRHKENEIEMTATETDDSFEVKGPDFELEINGKRKERPGEAVCRQACSVVEQLADITRNAMRKIELGFNACCPEFVLEQVSFLNTGAWRMMFSDLRSIIQVDATTFPSVNTTKRGAVSIDGSSVCVFIQGRDPAFIINAKSVDKALEELDAFFTKLKNSA